MPESSRHVPVDYKTFTYFISETYRDFASEQQTPITKVHTELVKMAFHILERDSGIPGLTFTFGGTYKDAPLDNAAYDKKIYVDFTAIALVAVGSNAAGAGEYRPSPTDASLSIGGRILLNSDFLPFNHPLGNTISTIMHETMHILGLDHSQAAESIMNYRER